MNKLLLLVYLSGQKGEAKAEKLDEEWASLHSGIFALLEICNQSSLNVSIRIKH